MGMVATPVPPASRCEEGEAWVLNGTKTWITNAGKSWKHKGVSSFIVPKATTDILERNIAKKEDTW